MPIFGIENEPYRGRELLVHFDKMLVECSEKVMLLPALSTKNEIAINELSSHQKMAIQVTNQSLNLAFSIRELVRQGYLFGSLTLERSFVERIIILLYLKEKPDDIGKWEAGWSTHHNNKNLKAPSFTKMADCIGGSQFKGFADSYNDLVHGKPKSIAHGLIVGADSYVVSPSKTLNNTKDCDALCWTITSWLVCLLAMIYHYFPEFMVTTDD
ncbi:hypothetical protein VCRA2120E57_740007 [Vibrio crassostreae]|nr:hypothetical protein VCRA2120E57_740007 [Vibrio crassostreae]